MREVRWERMFPDELEAAFAARPLVYFAYGLCEPHGPQNAVGLDALKAYGIACEAARAAGGIVAPPDFWHVHEIGGYALWASRAVGEVERKWLTSVPPWVHFKSVAYHVRAADVIGFRAAIFLTGHYGPNWKDLKRLLGLMQPYTKTRLFGLPDFEANDPGFDSDGKSGGDHAGKVETSLMWALDPDCVDFSRIPNEAREAPGAAVDVARRDPSFAMGRDAGLSDRRIGERMVRDEVAWLTAKSEALLAAYDPAVDVAGFPTFESVERFWDEEVRPILPDFACMAGDFGHGGEIDSGSVWYPNSKVPERS
jgi:creatinine amidohydrolase